MSLSSAMNTAQSIFNNTGTQTSVVSKNIANAGNANYARRAAVLSTTAFGAQVVTTERAQNAALLRENISSIAQSSGQQTLLSGLEEMKSILGGNDYETSPSGYMAALQNSLQDLASKPADAILAASVVTSAQDVANSLNTASAGLQSLRARADKEMATAVVKLNGLLKDFQTANDAVKNATATGGDANDALDQRETLLKQISEIVGVTTVTHENNDLALYTTSGTTLFETIPRTVSFSATATFDANTTGNQIYIDGSVLAPAEGGNTTAMGSLEALVQVRDVVAPTFQKQLDEVARGLIQVFSENTTPATTLKAGLFTWTASPSLSDTAILTGTTTVNGLASAIKVNSIAVANPSKIRDGINYALNTGGSGNSTLIDSYVTGLDAEKTFDPGNKIDNTSSVLSYATNSVGWLEDLRSNASTATETKSAMLARTTEAYSNVTGVSLDEELSLLLDIEQSYKASTKLVSAIDEMLQSLLDIAS